MGMPREYPCGMRILLLGEMMTLEVTTLHEDDSLDLADWDMKVGEIRHLPVIDHQRRVIGMVSDRDILRAASKHPHEPVSVGALMMRDVHACLPTVAALDAAAWLLESKRGALPVVDGEGRLLGIVTTSDFVELARRALAGHDVGQPHLRA